MRWKLQDWCVEEGKLIDSSEVIERIGIGPLFLPAVLEDQKEM